MKRLIAIFIGSTFMMPGILADDIEDIKALEQGHYAARNRADVDTWSSYHTAERDSFGPGGGLLSKPASLEEERKSLEAQLASGVKYNHQLRHIEVRVYGNTALSTSYVVGSSTSPDGTTSSVNMRRTTVLIKENGKWKEVHNHLSPVVLSQ
ncbi:MAG: nuclear transport factor 2 family protein [Acidobacteriota bacterium]